MALAIIYIIITTPEKERERSAAILNERSRLYPNNEDCVSRESSIVIQIATHMEPCTHMEMIYPKIYLKDKPE